MGKKMSRLCGSCLLLLVVLFSGCNRVENNRLVHPAAPRGGIIVQSDAVKKASHLGVPLMLVEGESMLLWDEELATTLHPIARIRSVFSYSKNGERIDYKEHHDWRVHDGQLQRVSGSHIPNFSTYSYSNATFCQQALFSKDCMRSIVRNSSHEGADAVTHNFNETQGFDFRSEPRNPGLTLGFYVYIDYETPKFDHTVLAVPLVNGEFSAVMCIGDSIVAGSHTVAHHYRKSDDDSWCGLLRQYLGKGRVVHNQSLPGGELRYLNDKIDSFIAKKPDAVIVALGMNDHMRGKMGLASFSSDLTGVIKKLKRNNIKVLLLGFFQQNKLWRLENSEDTADYNAAIFAVAKAQEVPFVDINAAFQSINGSMPTHYLMADFMHHPNNFGQRIYFSKVVPYFLTRDQPASRIKGYVMALP